MSLQEAVSGGVFGGLSIAGARTLRYRHPAAFPKRAGKDGTTLLYDLDELITFAAERMDR